MTRYTQPTTFYTKDHEWVTVHNDLATVGITHYAENALGDIVFVELPRPGTPMVAGEQFGTVESVKAVSELYAPVSGEVVEVNEELEDAPETINDSPYGDGWFFKMKLSDPDELEDLLDAAAYREVAENE